VLLFDIDNFKGYNDTYGHQAGDRCLQAVAKAIGDTTASTSGLSARYGGEEFAVVLPNTTEDAALKVAESIRLTVSGAGHSEYSFQSRIHHHQRGRRRQKTARRSTRPRWWGKPTPRYMKPSASAVIAASCIPPSTCNMSRASPSKHDGEVRAGRTDALERDPINPEWPADVRFDAHSGLKSDVA